MKKILLLFTLALVFMDGFAQDTEKEQWKTGVAKIDITPEFSMWMAGYGNRTEPSSGTLHQIWAKALALEDASGHRAVLVTADILGWPKGMSDEIRERLQEELNLTKAQVLLNSSHTHTGPVLGHSLQDIYPLNQEETGKINRYTDALVDRIVQLVQQAFNDLEPSEIYKGSGVARFQVNRRNNEAATLFRKSDLEGPNDYAVPVLKVLNSEGELKALTFGYACHPTVLSSNQWSGDYPGFAQLELEKDHPGATAMFFQGAGADQNPLPRRTVALAKQYGRTLAAAVDRVLEEEMQQLTPTLATGYTEVDLNLNEPPSREELAQQSETASGYYKRWADRMLKKIDNGESFRQTYPFPLQVWKIGNQPVFALGGELLIEYAIQLKEIFGHDSIVMGYSNDVMAYIPTAEVLHEGGYEGASSQVVYGLPSTWSYDIETTIMDGMVKLAKETGVAPVDNDLLE
ncbi:neutral/alkaline non-lysosomal ceramidase N-terminal domain-containing protein [Fodinibius sediminis]|uniref:Neutral ceramidase n=1 Tax=Fodinibius sediminis TaxID=1214077 RepID=A0A521CSP6_9BACT|nr:neutral/alkaline non-lysosomal ceramidase N-terminal domain-containing protein [Fodinibius sediminis]SMO62446.1 Neutral/alkaline non-lysosomal ceramidase, N-terminal [Fodinibius sediminis]